MQPSAAADLTVRSCNPIQLLCVPRPCRARIARLEGPFGIPSSVMGDFTIAFATRPRRLEA